MSQLAKEEYKSLHPLLEDLPKNYEMTDSDLIEMVRKKFLIPPATKKYNLENQFGFDTSMGQAEAVRRILKEQVS